LDWMGWDVSSGMTRYTGTMQSQSGKVCVRGDVSKNGISNAMKH